METLFEIDAVVHDAETIERAKQIARDYRPRLNSCNVLALLQDQSRCRLDTLLGEHGLGAEKPSSDPTKNSATAALLKGRGSCAALVALSLALTESKRSPFEAVILRKHVVLGSAHAADTYFEVLEQGRPLTELDLARHRPFPPNGLIRVGGRDYLAYYLDNLAARLAAAGEAELAEATFQRALEQLPGAPRIHYNYGTFLFQRERYESALTYLDSAIRLGWKDADTLVNRGATRWKLGRLKRARGDFEQALELDPQHRQATANLQRLERTEKDRQGPYQPLTSDDSENGSSNLPPAESSSRL